MAETAPSAPSSDGKMRPSARESASTYGASSTKQRVARRGSGISSIIATFLRVLLLPVICIGIPLWPVLGMLCAVPIIGVLTIPLFIATTALLLYSIAWFSYLVLAQADPPASSQHGHLAPYLPFLPFSPVRCLKINWVAFMYATTALRIAVPALLDWSYRRVMVLGTQGGGGGIVRENISYGSPSPGKRLDIYLPPANGPTFPASEPGRTRKHSTHFAEPGATPRTPEPGSRAGGKDGKNEPAGAAASAPVVVILPSPIPPLMWTKNRKTYLQLALRLRRMGCCVVVPEITTYPEGRVDASIVDLRLALHWIAENIKAYGGDERRIYLLGHGMSAHLAMLTLTQEAVVFSREGFLLNEEESRVSKQGPSEISRPRTPTLRDADDEDEHGHVVNGAKSYARAAARPITIPTSLPSSFPGRDDAGAPDESTWVDETGEDELPPGAVMAGNETLESYERHAQASSTGQESSISFSGSGTADGASSARRSNNTSQASNGASGSSISNGLRRVAIYGPEIEVPPVAGVILLAGIFDVIKCFRKESDRGIEHLSVLRRTCGPSHTLCLLHSPAHLLYAAKNVLDTSLLPPKFLLIHGGKDAVVDISQSTLLKTLLNGIGLGGVRLRAYRELGHVEAIASLFLGMGRSSTHYSKQILQDVGEFIGS